jgi:hypothetical protein
MRAEIAQRERFARFGAAKQDRLAQDQLVNELLLAQSPCGQREIPKVAEEFDGHRGTLPNRDGSCKAGK